MKCGLCAEEIQDEAILCRYCGAIRQDGTWRHPAMAPASPPRVKGRLALQSTGVLLLLAAVMELPGLTAPFPLLGAMRGGAAAILYHAAYAVLFGGLGFYLVRCAGRGMPWLIAMTAFYTVDKAQQFLDTGARAQLLNQTLGKDVLDMLGKSTAESIYSLLIAGVLLGWWGFAVYAWIRRDSWTDGRQRATTSP